MTTATAPHTEPHHPRPASRTSQYVSFWLAGQLFGVPVDVVQEVLNPQAVARTPLARPEVAGLLNLRGQIVTAVCLRRRLGLPDADDVSHCMHVVLRHEGESYSLLVDDVGDVIDVTRDGIEPAPRTLDANWQSMIEGVYQLEARLFVLFNVAAVLRMT